MPSSPRTPADALRAADDNHRHGRLQDAERLYRAVLKNDSRSVPALMGLARIAAQTGHAPAARDLLHKALSLAPNDANALVTLGQVELSLGNPANAETVLDAAVRAQSRNAIAWNLLGLARQHLGKTTEAETAFRKATRLEPKFADALNNLATNLMLRGDHEDEALKIYRKCVTLAPRAYTPHMNIGILLGRRGKIDTALEHAGKAVELAPKAADARFNLGRLLHDAGHLEKAEKAYQAAVALAPNNASFLNNLSLVSDPLLKEQQAIDAAEKAVALHRGPIGEFHTNLLTLYITHGLLQEAADTVERFLKQEPDNANILAYRADVAARQGRFDEAQAQYEALLKDDPLNTRALCGIARTQRLEPGMTVFEGLRTAAETVDLPEDERINVHFALGKAHDDIGDPRTAFIHYNIANAAKARRHPYDSAAWEDTVSAVIDTFTPGFFAERAGWGNPSERPAFVVGMPRSGTTLVEQTLASHAQVTGADELRDLNLIEQMINRRVGYPKGVTGMDSKTVLALADLYLGHLERLDPNAARTTDKLPGNALRLGLIALLLPNARIVHCRRDPVDTCVSIYFQNFSGRHDYSWDLKALGHFYQQYERLMAHWHRVLPLPILDVVYEDVVADHEGQARRMIAHLGLEWDDAMTRYYENKRSISTASLWQARQPIYTRSVQRWRKYEADIGPLLESLGLDTNPA